MRHLQQVVFQIFERGETHRHDSQHGKVLPLQVVRKGVQVLKRDLRILDFSTIRIGFFRNYYYVLPFVVF